MKEVFFWPKAHKMPGTALSMEDNQVNVIVVKEGSKSLYAINPMEEQVNVIVVNEVSKSCNAINSRYVLNPFNLSPS
jgi:hypothetical protein